VGASRRICGDFSRFGAEIVLTLSSTLSHFRACFRGARPDSAIAPRDRFDRLSAA